MTVPLLRVCYHCGYPTPGRHATSCRDADSGVVEVAKHTPPAEVARLRQELDEARFERDQEAHARKVNEFGLLAKLRDAEAERDRMRPVVEAAEAWRDGWGSGWVQALTVNGQRDLSQSRVARLLAAVVAYRSATPDAPPLASLIGALPGATLADWSATPDATWKPVKEGDSNPGAIEPGEDVEIQPIDAADERDQSCIERWPECFVGGYDPRCCRFPKSCSCWKEAAGVPVDTEEATP